VVLKGYQQNMLPRRVKLNVATLGTVPTPTPRLLIKSIPSDFPGERSSKVVAECPLPGPCREEFGREPGQCVWHSDSSSRWCRIRIALHLVHRQRVRFCNKPALDFFVLYIPMPMRKPGEWSGVAAVAVAVANVSAGTGRCRA
jgi:hypothetical protein